MTEPGTPGRLGNEQDAETTGASLSDALPTRRSLRAQREAGPGASQDAEEAPVVDSSAVSGVTDASSAGATSEAAVTDASGTDAAADAAASAVAAVHLVKPPVLDARSTSASYTAAVAAAERQRRAIAVPAPKTAQPTRSKKRPLGVITALLVIPGVFFTVALPAYAFTPGSTDVFQESDTHELAEAGAQSVDVSSAAAKITVSRDGYTAVSGEEIRRKTAEAQRAAQAQAAAEAAAKAGSYSTPGQRQEGDDYPWPGGTVGVLSPLNYEYRECVDFVAWRLNRDVGATGPFRWVWSKLTPGGGSAWNWANAWESHGWQVSHDPIVGSVAWFTANHVAYVQSVNGDGTVTIEEYNQNSDHNYHRRTIPIGSVDLFLYPPPV